MKLCHTILIILFRHASAHGGHHHGHDDHDHNHGGNPNLRRNLNDFDSPPGAANGHCKRGEPTFAIGGVTYDCEADFNAKGGQCHTPDQTPEQAAVAAADFKLWKETKKGGSKGKGKGSGTRGRRLSGCTGDDCAGFDAGKIVTIPVHFHIFHNRNDGIEYTCTGSYETGFQDGAGDCNYIQDQIRQINKGFRGIAVDGHGAYHEDTQFQFCLASSNDLFDASAYNNRKALSDRGGYKSTFRVGQMETFNVWVNKAGGYLGYAQFPTSSFSTSDGVVLLNDSVSILHLHRSCFCILKKRLESRIQSVLTIIILNSSLLHRCPVEMLASTVLAILSLMKLVTGLDFIIRFRGGVVARPEIIKTEHQAVQ